MPDSRFVKLNRAVYFWIATAILLVAALLRLFLLQDVPPGLSQDEVLNADIVTFIREGNHALFFREGYGHEPLYHYWAVPFQKLFGDNVLSIRLPAAYLGLLFLAATMSWVRREFGKLAALVIGVGLAISWWPIIFSRVGIRPILEPLLLVLVVWFWPRRPWLAGVFLGLSAYSYTAARYLFLIPFFMAIYLVVFHPESRSRHVTNRPSYSNLVSALKVLAVSLVMFLPLALTLRNDPSLQQRVDQLSEPIDQLLEGEISPVLESTRLTLGVFSFVGDPRWTYGPPGLPFFDSLTSIFFYLGFLLVVLRWRKPKYALVLIWFLLSVLPSSVTPDAPSTIRLIGAVPLVYLMPALAVQFASERTRLLMGPHTPLRTASRVTFWGLIMALIVLNLWRTLDRGFNFWPQQLETRVKYQSVLLDMARYWEDNPVDELVVADAYFEPIDADSFRRNLANEPVVRWVQSGSAVAGAIVVPERSEDARLYVPEYAGLPGQLLEVSGLSPNPLHRSDNKPSFAVYPFREAAPAPMYNLNVSLEEAITLLGYTVLDPGDEQTLEFVSFWRVDSTLDEDITIFVHLVDETGTIVSQHDGIDTPVNFLRRGDRLLQYHALDLSGVNKNEHLTLQIGMYHRLNGIRLLHQGTPDDKVILGEGINLTFDWLDSAR